MTTIIKGFMLLTGTALLVSACGDDPKAATKANIEQALNFHYAQNQLTQKI